MIKANILVKTSMFNESKREVSDISFKHFMEHEIQHEEVVYCFTDSELEQLKREYFLAGWKASADYIGPESEEVINKYLDIDLATYEASKKEIEK